MTGPVTPAPPPATAAATTAAPAPADAKLRKAAQGFEAVFLRQMIGAMRSASLGDGVFDSDATRQFRDMSDAQVADQMASKGALHIADMLVKQYGARLAADAGKTGSTAR